MEEREGRTVPGYWFKHQGEEDQWVVDFFIWSDNWEYWCFSSAFPVIDSFQYYTKVEKCKGADKIQTEEYGPQEGVKGVIFKHFPPVMYLILGRISFDMKLFKFSKINDK